MSSCSRYHLRCAGLDEEKNEEYKEESFDWFCNPCKEDLTRSEFQCPLCSEVLLNQRSSIYKHYALNHFRTDMENLIKSFGTFDKRVCHQCGNRSRGLYAHINHAAVKHNHLEKVLPFHLHIQKLTIPTFKKLRQTLSISKVKKLKRSLKKPLTNTKTNTVSKSTRTNNIFKSPENLLFRRKLRVNLINCNKILLQLKSSAEQKTKGKEELGLSCRLCAKKKQFSNRHNLYKHYSLIHFKKEILKDYVWTYQEDGVDKVLCLLCTARRGVIEKKWSLGDAISHVGNTHNIVDKFLPDNYHIPKQMKGPLFGKQKDCLEEEHVDVILESVPKMSELQSAGQDFNYQSTRDSKRQEKSQ